MLMLPLIKPHNDILLSFKDSGVYPSSIFISAVPAYDYIFAIADGLYLFPSPLIFMDCGDIYC